MDAQLNFFSTFALKVVLETTIDQLAIVGGTLPNVSNDNHYGLHQNVSPKTLEELLQKEQKLLRVRLVVVLQFRKYLFIK